ncbi:ABC transporter ATP-binding protein [Paracoccaceae bacterium Fryx2]|nr:ABC transporter ATP-binding protein [Paracoccaceae bacterium Fryx2]
MIRLKNLSKTFWVQGEPRVVAAGINATFPTGARVGLLGINGAGKSSLLSMIAGTLEPDTGEVLSDGTISWPVGFRGSFHRDLTGAQNTRFIARIYGVDTEALSDFVEDFAELGRQYHQPFRSYSSGMRSRLSFGVSMGIRFDTYLVDEATSVGDAVFKTKSNRVFLERMHESSAIVVTHSMGKIRQLCTMGAVLDQGQLHVYDDVDEAIAHHEDIVAQTLGTRGDDEDPEDD